MKSLKAENFPAERLIYLCISILIFITICGCSRSSDEEVEAIRKAIQADDLEKASELLDSTGQANSIENSHIYYYNKAVIQILSGQCDSALQILEMIHDHNSLSFNHSELLNEEMNDETNQGVTVEDLERLAEETKKGITAYHENERLFFALIHQAQAAALLCPMDLSRKHDDENYRNILLNLYTSYSLGLDVRKQIETVLNMWVPDCTTFIPETQTNASRYNNALDIRSLHTTSTVVCRNGVWIRLHSHAHEIYYPSFSLKPLPRTIWQDDSMRLPFAQLHYDLHRIDANGKPEKTPVKHFEQELPKAPPPLSDYENIHWELPAMKATADKDYLIHLYTLDHGEVIIKGTGSKKIDCNYADNELTWTRDLKPKRAELNDGSHYENLVLCPTRPDLFGFDLEPNQEAFFSLLTQTGDSTNTYIPKLKFEIKDENQNLLKQYGEQDNHPTISDVSDPLLSQPEERKDEFFVFTYSEDAGKDELKIGAPFFVYIRNVTDQKHSYSLLVNNEDEPQVLEYTLSFAKSSECKDKMEHKIVPLNLKDLEKKGVIFQKPVWICPNQPIHYTADDAVGVLRTYIQLGFISDKVLKPGEVRMDAAIQVSDSNNEYPIAEGITASILLKPAEFIYSGNLYNPITRRSILRGISQQHGFSVVVVSLSDDDKDNKNENKNSQDDKKDEKKEQQDKSKKQDTPNKSPDKPSETPATPHGAGNESSGDAGEPDEKVQGNKAFIYDPTQSERDYINALLNDYEKGYLYIPISGSENERVTDKDW